MRTSMAYLAGAGTVVVAMALGVGGGFMISSAVSPTTPPKGAVMSKFEQETSKPISVVSTPAAAASEPAAVAQPAAVAAAVPASNQVQAPREVVAAVPAQPAPNVSSPAPIAAAPREQARADSKPSDIKAPETRTSDARSSDDSYAKARDTDLQREARRAEREKRRAERRQQWADRRRPAASQDEELRDVERKVRAETEPSPVVEPARVEMPRIKLFGDD